MEGLKSLTKPIAIRRLSTAKLIKQLLLVLGIVYLIFALLEPFEFHVGEYNKFGILLLFSAAYFITLFIALKWLYPLFLAITKLKRFYLHHLILQYLGLIVLVTTTHYGVQHYLNDNFVLDLPVYLQFLKHGLALGLIPTVILVLIEYNKALQGSKGIQKTTLPSFLNPIAQKDSVIISALHTKECFRFRPNAIVYIKSDDNYVHVHYFGDDNKELHRKLIRTNLKTLEDTLALPFVRTHRSYMVNLNHVKKVTGNVKGMRLFITALDTMIPVSRGYVATFKNSFHS